MYIHHLVPGHWYETSLAWAEGGRLRLDSVSKTERGWKLLLHDTDQDWDFPEEIEVRHGDEVPELICEWERSERNPLRTENTDQLRLEEVLLKLGYGSFHVDAKGTLHLHGDTGETAELACDLEELQAIRAGS